MHCHTVHLPLGTLLTVCAVCGTVARCLLKDPPIVVLDEATSALDSVTEVAVHEALSQLGTGRTQLIIAHRLSTIAGASQIVVLQEGRVREVGTRPHTWRTPTPCTSHSVHCGSHAPCVVQVGTHAQLLEMEGLYHSLWTTQQEAAAGAAAGARTAAGAQEE